MQNSSKPELHLFIIWYNARNNQKRILDDLAENFRIKAVYEIFWSQNFFSQNLTRFYGQNLPDRSAKEIHCGKGPFILITLEDPAPVYQIRNTSHGPSIVNINTFEAKQKYRQWTGGGHRIHATDSEKETAHDLMLLLHETLDSYKSSHLTDWNRELLQVHGDCYGATGWKSMRELLSVLNYLQTYVVLRNFEGLPDQYTMQSHGDIDLLVEDPVSTAYLLNAAPVFPNTPRVLHYTVVNNQKVLFDFRSVGDNYYDKRWEVDILKRRVLHDNGFFCPDKIDYFYSLLYHALVHKPSIAPDYIVRLKSIAESIELNCQINWNDISCLNSIVSDFLSQNNYSYIEPSDASVFLNQSNTNLKKVSLNRLVATSKNINELVLSVIKNTSDRTSSSEELGHPFLTRNNTIRDHFSWHRTLLPAVLEIPAGSSVLEIGTSSGVITRFLGEKCKDVTGLEEDPLMAEAASLRCLDLTNVKIIRSFSEIDSNKRFDCICIFTNQNDNLISISNKLRNASKYLLETGKICLAVIHQNSSPGSIDNSNKMNKDEVELLFNGIGLYHFSFLYAFPDHHRAYCYLTQDALLTENRAINDWVTSVTLNNVLTSSKDPFSNEQSDFPTSEIPAKIPCSIVITACKHQVDNPAWIIKSFAGDPRVPKLRAQTTLLSKNSAFLVQKEGTPCSCGIFKFDPVCTSPLFNGPTLDKMLYSLLQKGDRQGFISLLNEQSKFLMNTFTINTDYPGFAGSNDSFISGDAFDAIGRNIIVSENGWSSFDQEWKSTLPLPVSFILFRTVKNLIEYTGPAKFCSLFGIQQNLNLLSSAASVLNELYIVDSAGTFMYELYSDLEKSFYAFVMNGNVGYIKPHYEQLLEIIKKFKSTHGVTINLKQIEKMVYSS